MKNEESRLAIFLGILLFLAGPLTQAGEKECTEFRQPSGAFYVYRFQSGDEQCFLSADPRETNNMVYRSYLLTSEGMLMVFNSFDRGASGASDGARVFHFFPRAQMPSLSFDDKANVVLQTTNPAISLVLSREQTQISGMIGGVVVEDPQIHPQNNGGVELSQVQSLYLDSGFTTRADPTGNPSRNSVFIDSRQRKCSVKNKEVFKYDESGDSKFKFSDEELKAWLLKRCPQLVWDN